MLKNKYNPMISIIVPVYNVDKYLSTCIDSIINQTYKNLEIILVDDGSTDNCGKICDMYKTIDSRIKVIHKKNGGLSDARNKGIDMSTGKYIGLVDSDDYIHPQMYEILYSNMVKYNGDIVVCNYVKYESYDFYAYQNIDDKVEIYNNIDSLDLVFGEKEGQCITPWNKIYNRNIFKNLRFEVGKIYEDKLISHRILYTSKRTIFIPNILYFYRQRKGSLSHSEFNIKTLDSLYAYRDAMIFLYSNANDYAKLKSQNTYVYYFFKDYFRAKKFLNEKDDLKKIKKEFISTFYILMRSKNFRIREKISWVIFAINDNLYEVVFKKLYNKIKLEGNECKEKFGQP